MEHLQEKQNCQKLYILIFSWFLILFLGTINTYAQCPVTNSCTPGNAPASSLPFGMGIFNVTTGSGANGFINPTTGGSSAGNQDYSCLKKATVLEGVATPISVTTNPNVNENVRVWIDLNNNGIFEQVTELVFSSNHNQVHAGTFTVPVSPSVVKNQVLRMRVSADNYSSPVPTPCSTPEYSQVEDYGIIVLANFQKPLVNFSAATPVTCSPTVQFSQQVQNGATSYLWSFGDNTTSTLANPAHTYPATGTYTVKLKACNASGCDSLVKTNYINYHTNNPVAASCTPVTSNYCCGYGITKVTFASMVNASANASAGYEDFTCSKLITVEEGQSYPLSIETSPANNQDTRVYIDFNNNGSFEASELVFTKLNFINPFGIITIPTGKVLNTPLRLRIISDEQGSATSPCANPSLGQAEDYTITITQPKITFSANNNSICNSLIEFTTANTGATSWFWDFGDGTTSAQQNPQHNYTANGIYSVKLKACSPAGCDSVTKTNLIVINKPCPTYCTPNISNNSGFFISQVKLNTLDNFSLHDPNGYGNYLSKSTIIHIGSYYKLSVLASNNLGLANRTLAWIDFNRDGDFNDSGEEIAFSNRNNFSQAVFIPTSASSGVTRLRIITSTDSVKINSCLTNLQDGETEDYSIEIKPVSQKPVAYFSYAINPCNGLSVQFADSSSNLLRSWEWNFGDPASGINNTSRLPNPTHVFSSAGTYNVQVIACNNFGCDTLQKVVTVQATTVPVPLNYCIPTNTVTPKNYFGIEKVVLNTINNNTSGAADGYKNYVCSQRTSLEQLNTYSLTIQTAKLAFSTPPRRPFFENVKVWIDFNNDGYFFGSNELVLDSRGRTTHSVNLVPPMTAVINQPLRMRVANMFTQSWRPVTIPHCILPDSGEVEDYSITIVPYTNLPVSAFTQDALIGCGSPIQFRDTSTFFPTSWSWNFGDPASGTSNTSTLQNPSHTFSGPGSYTVSLTACNSNGCNTTIRTNYITVPSNITIAPVTCKPQTANYCCGN